MRKGKKKRWSNEKHRDGEASAWLGSSRPSIFWLVLVNLERCVDEIKMNNNNEIQN